MAGTVKVKAHKRNGKTVKGYIRHLGRSIKRALVGRPESAKRDRHDRQKTQRRMRRGFSKTAMKNHRIIRHLGAKAARKRRRTRVA